jgi:serine/threonine protein kinase
MPIQDECDEWKANPGKNPRTGRSISPRGKIYQWYQKNCGDVGVPAVSSTPTPQTWFTQRLENGLRINNNLRSINADQWDMCMSGTNAPAFRSNFSDIVEIGKGTFGQVYRATLANDKLVIKEAYLEPNEKRVLKESTTQNQTWEAVEKNSYPRENRILDLVNQLLLSRRCPNFVYVYNMAMCDGCKVKRLFDNTVASGSCYVTFMESADTDLGHIDLINFDEQLSVLYQLLIAVYAIHRYYAIWHRDIKTSNVFVQLIKPGGYFEYVIEGKSYFVKNMGIVVYLADFGVSSVMSPLYAFTNYYGTRNAEVMRSSEEVGGSYLYWRPISVSNKQTLIWTGGRPNPFVKATRNVITDPNIESSVPINLNNSQKFPAFEFYDDIQDVIRMFVGGKQTAQQGNHLPMKGLSPQLRDLITQKKAYLSIKNNLYRISGTVKYVLANEMLDHLYIKPRAVDNIVDRFVM